ncbi:MAG: DUF2442 domain-containing protein [Bacteroidia bacterium]
MSYLNTPLKLKDIRFSPGAIELIFEDGRFLVSPLKNFPEIKKLNAAQRKKYHIIGGEGFDFDDNDEVYHIADFIGNTPADFSSRKNQSRVNERTSDYRRKGKRSGAG